MVNFVPSPLSKTENTNKLNFHCWLLIIPMKLFHCKQSKVKGPVRFDVAMLRRLCTMFLIEIRMYISKIPLYLFYVYIFNDTMDSVV